MDFELKNYEDKINNITEQFMSLLNSKTTVEDTVTNSCENVTKGYEHLFEASVPDCGAVCSTIVPDSNQAYGAFKMSAEDVDFGNVPYEKFENGDSVSHHAVSFDNVNVDELNARLEQLYEERKSSKTFAPVSHIAFSDTNMTTGKTMCQPYTRSYGSSYTNDNILCSTKEKEEANMANYEKGTENAFYGFATVPVERSLTTKRSFSDVLFQDIPWDTKIDFLGAFKSIFNTDVKITF